MIEKGLLSSDVFIFLNSFGFSFHKMVQLEFEICNTVSQIYTLGIFAILEQRILFVIQRQIKK
jgi:hypothetical protein